MIKNRGIAKLTNRNVVRHKTTKQNSMKISELIKYIESKRGDKNIFFVCLIRIKDFLWWEIYIKRFTRLIFRIYCALFFKDKYGLTFVIAKYKEDVSWLKHLPYKFVLYDKDDGEDCCKKKYQPYCPESIKLQNVGREAHTYLTYIIDNYKNLPNFVAFMQADPFDYSPLLALVIQKFKGQEYYPLSPLMHYSKSDDYEYKYIKTIEKVTAKHLGVQKDFFEFPFGAQFIVSKNKILKHDIEEYKFLLNKLVEFENIDAGCTKFPKHKKPCPCLGDFSAWMLEVWWPIFFGENKNLIKYN